MLHHRRVECGRRRGGLGHRLQGSPGLLELLGQLGLERFCGRRLGLVACVFASHGFGEGTLPVGAFLRELEGVLRGRQLEPQLSQLSLPSEAPVLGRLNLSPRGLELVLCRLGQLARLCQLSLQGLRLAGGAAMSIPGLAPLLPHDAASEQVEPRGRLGSLAGRCSLCLDDLETRLDLRPEILEPQQVLGKLGQPLARFLPPLFDAAHLRRLLQQLPTLGGRAHDDVLDVVLVDDRVRVESEAGRR